MALSVPATPPPAVPAAALPAAARDGSWEPGDPYGLAATLGILQRGTHDPVLRIAGGPAADPAASWLAFTTAQGPVTLRLSEEITGSGTLIRARAWGPGRDAGIESLPALLGARDSWAGFDAEPFSATLPRLVTEARRRHRTLRLPATGRMLDALVPAILEQKVTVIEARFAWRYLVNKYGSPPPGPAPAWLRLAPTPEQWRRIPSWEWHAARVDAKRSATILRAAGAASGLERLAARPLGPELAAGLQSIPGIGPWTVAETTQRTHGDPDSVSVGDFHLASFVGYALTGRKTDDAGMLALLEPWRGHRQRVVRMLALSGFRKPAFGPRLAPADHRRR